MLKLVRITTVPLSLKKLLTGQMHYMQNHGFEVIMMSADGDGIDALKESEGVSHIIIPMTRKITPFQDLYSLLLLIYQFIKIKPDIVHSHTPKAGLLAMIAAWITRVPIRLHTVAGLPLMATVGLKTKLLILIEKLTYAAATLVLPNSYSLKKYIIDNNLCDTKKLDIIGQGSSNGIDIAEFERANLIPVVLEKIKDQIKYNSEFKYLVAVGRMVKDKGIAELVDVFEQISDLYAGQVKLILVGHFEPDLDPLPISTLNKIATNTNIISIGFSDKVPYFMAIADIFIHPSHREGFPNVLLQAGMMKCPIICSNIVGNIDIIEKETEGVIFPVKDKDSLLGAIQFGLNNPAILKLKSEVLYHKIINNFDRTIIHNLIRQKYLTLIEAVV